jgi:predicted RNA-binding Zn-ribbon protein involved in translation (DUF1610 family)
VRCDDCVANSRVWRAGVRFDCPECGRLWRDDDAHAEELHGGCLSCGADLRLVGLGEHLVEYARWYRCRVCQTLHMRRRGEIVETRPRSGFDEFS